MANLEGTIITRVQLFIVTTLLLFFRKPPDKYIQMGRMIVVKMPTMYIEQKRIYQLISILVLLMNGIVPHPKSATSLDVKALPTLQSTPNEIDKPRAMGYWASEASPIVVDSATTKTITPHLSDLVDAQRFNTSITGLGKGK